MSATKLTKEERDIQTQITQAANAETHRLVVKIITWRTGLAEGFSTNKITAEEWERYKKHLLNISKTDSVEKVKGKLKETYDSIKMRGGFE